jgi:hypothetical protein
LLELGPRSVETLANGKHNELKSEPKEIMRVTPFARGIDDDC